MQRPPIHSVIARFSALIILLLVSSTVCSQIDQHSDNQCELPTRGVPASIGHVTDGDSLVLVDGTRVRIIGINSPELYTKQGAAQPHAADAQAYVDLLIRANDNTVTLYTGQETTDQHGRRLFHVFLQNGRNLAKALLVQGLAVQSAVAPNTLCAEHYSDVENRARAGKRGIWGNPEFWLIDQRAMKKSAKGFHIVRDHVIDVSPHKSGIRITLRHGIAITTKLAETMRFSAKDQAGTKAVSVSKLVGRLVEVRGWFYRHRRKHYVTLHHPANLSLR